MVEDRTKDWFVANVRELRWQENELGATCEFDKHRERFEEFGINLTVLRPHQPMTMYHRERLPGGVPRLAWRVLADRGGSGSAAAPVGLLPLPS